MLAYSNGSLSFRDSSVPIPNHFNSVSSGPSFSLTGDGSSDSCEESVDENDLKSRTQKSRATTMDELTKPLDLRPTVLPAEHNTIVQVRQQISMPWANLFEFECFNAVQSACFNIAACADENLVISAPTGCGKTVVFELGILRLLSCRVSTEAKVVFLAPIKALCQEKVRDWSSRFSGLGITVVELTGDATNKDVAKVSKADIICTTPEKWDSITRRWAEHIYLLGKVQLLLVDEAHNINAADTRGATLEAVVCRMKTVSRSASVIKHKLPAMTLRIIAVSATLPNLEDIGVFVHAKAENVMAFDASFRPVPLAVHVLAYPAQSSEYWFEKSLERKVPEVVAKYSGGRPSLVFCGSRKSAEATADLLGKGISAWNRNSEVVAGAQRVADEKLKAALLRGVAFHHANLSPMEKSLVEDLFRGRKLGCLCCTSTLAMGVNLPAHLVVIKSTAQWQGKAQGYSQMPSSALNQMMGRAGRPGLDESGVAVIMTGEAHRQHYQNLAHGSEVVESNLHEDLVGILNAEVCNKVIESVDDADEWIKGTFLFARLKKNPVRYGLRPPPGTAIGAPLKDEVVTAFLSEKIRLAFLELTESENPILQFDEDRIVVSPLQPSFIMSRQMLRLETMKSIFAMPLDANIEDTLKLLSTTKEVLQEIRHGQKKVLKDLIPAVRFSPGPKSMKLESNEKTFLLFQCFLGRLSIDDPTMAREKHIVAESAGRVLNAMVDHSLNVGAGRAIISATMLRRNLAQGLWEVGVSELFQLPDSLLPPAMVDKLAGAGISSFSDLAGASPFLVEKVASRRQPFGAKLITAAQKILKQALTISIQVDKDDGKNIHVAVANKVSESNAGSSSSSSSSASSSSSSSSSSFSSSLSSEWDFMDGRMGLGGVKGGGDGRTIGSSSPNDVVLEFTLVAFTKQPRNLKTGGGHKGVNGVHLFRKLTGPCTVELPSSSLAAVQSSTLCVSLLANLVGFDEHRSLTLPGAAASVGSSRTDATSSSLPKPPPTSPFGSEHGFDEGEKSVNVATKPSRGKPQTATSSASAASSPTSSTGQLASSSSSSSSTSSDPSSNLSSHLTEEHARTLLDETGVATELSKPPKKKNGVRKVDSLDKFAYSPSPTSTAKRSSGLTAPTSSGGFANGDDGFVGAMSFEHGRGAGVSVSNEERGEAFEEAWSTEGRNKKGGASSQLSSPAGSHPRTSGFSRKATTGSRDIQHAVGGVGGVLSTLRRKAGEMNLVETVKSSRLLPSSSSLLGPPEQTEFENSSQFTVKRQSNEYHTQDQQQNLGAGTPDALSTWRSPSKPLLTNHPREVPSVSSFFKQPAQIQRRPANSTGNFHEGVNNGKPRPFAESSASSTLLNSGVSKPRSPFREGHQRHFQNQDNQLDPQKRRPAQPVRHRDSPHLPQPQSSKKTEELQHGEWPRPASPPPGTRMGNMGGYLTTKPPLERAKPPHINQVQLQMQRQHQSLTTQSLTTQMRSHNQEQPKVQLQLLPREQYYPQPHQLGVMSTGPSSVREGGSPADTGLSLEQVAREHGLHQHERIHQLQQHGSQQDVHSKHKRTPEASSDTRSQFKSARLTDAPRGKPAPPKVGLGRAIRKPLEDAPPTKINFDVFFD